MEVVPEVVLSLAEEFLVEEYLNYGNILLHIYNTVSSLVKILLVFTLSPSSPVSRWRFCPDGVCCQLRFSLVSERRSFTIHVSVLIPLKGVLYARSSRLIPDKANLGFRFSCDGPGRGGTCQVSAWDHVFLGLFWMYNSLSIVIFHFSWKMQSDIWGTVNADGSVAHITNGNFAQSAITINGWLRDYLWAQAVQVINSYGSNTSAYGIMFLGAHFIWAFSLMFLFSGRGYWQELIESIVWAHNKLKVAPAIQPRALSIIQGRAVGVAHYLLGGIATTWAFFHAHILVVG